MRSKLAYGRFSCLCKQSILCLQGGFTLTRRTNVARSTSVTSPPTVSDESESPPAAVSFASIDQLREILTECRIELLRALIAIDGAAESISTLANVLARDYRPVHDDVTILDRHGLIFIVEEGRTKRPYVPYRRVHLDVELASDAESEEPASA